MLRVTTIHPHALYNCATTRSLEQWAQSQLPAGTLMQRAGWAVARLTLAVAPHARRIWIACGPGNNGGDGLQAAIHLHHWGKQVCVTWLGQASTPADAAQAHQRLIAAGVPIADEPPEAFDVCIDALLGIGGQLREPSARMAQWMEWMQRSGKPVLAVDTPSGLNADTGVASALHVHAHHTLSLLTLKPGLFTAQGRDACGSVWFDDLGVGADTITQAPSPSAWLAGAPKLQARQHNSHKGSFGDVAIVGGAQGMTGAALLAGQAALYAGAGRVYVALLADQPLPIAGVPAELMFRNVQHLDVSGMTVVCGCGGGETVRSILPQILANAAAAVIDADGLNAMADDEALQHAPDERSRHTHPTVLTPHPLEAARLLGCTAADIQHDRLQAACSLSQRLNCTVVLKGSGTVIAAPNRAPVINPTGSARLATAGTGDVLAGMIGALLAQGVPEWEAACQAVYRHGEIADHWDSESPLTASLLAGRW